MYSNIKEYAIDLFLCLTAIGAKIYASITGLQLFAGNWHFDKVVYVLTLILTGVTTLYRFIKEVRTDLKQKRNVNESGSDMSNNKKQEQNVKN